MLKSKAFTLIEILVVLVIVGFLMAIVGPRVAQYMGKTDVAKLKIRMSQVQEQLISYKQDMGHYPNKREGGIQALIYRPNTPGAEKWDGPYITSEEDIYDAFGDPFELNIPPVRSKTFRFFEIVAPHPSGDEGKEIIIGA